jgi:hypothetical protein
MLTIGIIVLGVIALFSMVMMIGTVLAKSPYGRYWAFLGGASVFLAGVLVALRTFVPSLETNASEGNAEAQSKSGEMKVDVVAATDGQPDAAQAQPAPKSLGSSAAGVDNELEFLSEVMELLKAGKSLPPEYLALLPDGGQGILATQSKSGVPTPQLSKPLQTQLVSLDRNDGQARFAGNSYVPSKPSSSTVGTGQSIGSSTAAAPTSQPQSPASSTPPASQPPVTPPPQTTPPSQTTPPATKPPQQDQKPAPPTSSVATLLDGGLLKSVLGASKAQMQNYFQYNQFLGQSGNVFRYLVGDKIVEVTLSSDKVTKVVMRFQSFSPAGKDMAYYEDLMRGHVGMTKAVPTSKSGQDIYWNGVYPGASSILFHIDTAANYGYVQATL